MKVSEVTNIDLAKYVRLDDASDLELNELERMRSGAVAFIKSYTGLTDEEVDYVIKQFITEIIKWTANR